MTTIQSQGQVDVELLVFSKAIDKDPVIVFLSNCPTTASMDQSQHG